MEKESGDIVSDFLLRQAYYSGRNALLQRRAELFSGDHWSSITRTPVSSDDEVFELTVNYLRNVVLRFAAILARQPRPKVPIAAPPQSQSAASAGAAERLLLTVWPQLMETWYDVEIDASKLAYGVLQCIWRPGSKPDLVQRGYGNDRSEQKMYLHTRSPLVFRCIPADRFYPVYRTYDKPNDFLEVFRYDPGRLIKDIEEKYNVDLQPTGQDVGGTETCDLIERWDCEHYQLVAMTSYLVDKRSPGARRRPPRDSDLSWEDRYVTLESGEHQYGRAPFWVLQNIRVDSHQDPTHYGAMADLDDISALNLHYDAMASEQAADIATNIHRPLVYSSESHEQDPSSISFEAGAVIPIGAEEELEPLAPPQESASVQYHLEMIKSAIQDLSFLGQAGFGQIPQGATTMGFRIALTPQQQIVELKLPLREAILRDVCFFLIDVFKRHLKDDKFQTFIRKRYGQAELGYVTSEDLEDFSEVEISYGNLLPRDDAAHEQGEVYKYKTGSQSLFTTLDHLGFDDPNAEMMKIKAELQDPVLNPQHALLVKQAQAMSQQQQQPPQQPQQPGAGGNGQQPPQRQTQPPVPPENPFARSEEGGQYGAGQATPFLGRSTGPQFGEPAGTPQMGTPGAGGMDFLMQKLGGRK